MGNKKLASYTGDIPFIEKGEKGAVIRQHVGFVDGSYSYLSGSDGEDFQDFVRVNGKWYMCTVSYSSSSPSVTDTVNGKSCWTIGSNFDFVATQVFLADRAAINLLGTNQINLYNADGSIFGSFRTGDDYALWLGAATPQNAPFWVKKNGEMYALKGVFQGEIQGVKGSFTRLSAIGSDGKSGGDISLNSDGQLEFNADIYNQGSKPGRGGWRFYANNIWGRGAFGHYGSTLAVVKGGLMTIYPDGYANTNTKEQVKLSSSLNNGHSVYEIKLYSPSDASSGCPIDVVVFDSENVDRYYEFIPGGTGKSWIAINANDNNNTVHFCDVGGWHTLNGGAAIHLTYINPALITPSLPSSRYGRGIFWTGERDLNWS